MKLLRVLGKRGRITIPLEIRLRMGLTQNDVLSFAESADGKTVCITREALCTCGGANTKEKTLYDFLNDLSDEQKRAALIHLSMSVAKKEGA